MSGERNMSDDEEGNGCFAEQEEALLALSEHRAKEVEHLKQRVAYYISQLKEAEARLQDTQTRLARLRREAKKLSSSKKSFVEGGIKRVKVERRSASPIQIIDESLNDEPRAKPELLIPSVNPKISQPVKLAGSGGKSSKGSGAQVNPLMPTHSNGGPKVKIEKHYKTSPSREESQQKGTKRKFERKEHKELIPLIQRNSTPCIIRSRSSTLIPSQHKRKLRSLSLCPVNAQLFVTSALDGIVNLWQVQSKGSSASLLSATDCVSPKQRRWPEDIAWHPEGHSLFCVYTADASESQISVLNLNKSQGRDRVTFLEEKPHLKGVINSVIFMPWEETCFVTGGSDHAVVLWNEKDEENSWKPKSLHRNIHSSAVMGVAGMHHKPLVLSAGADKRIIGYDIQAARTDYKHQTESKCMSVLPNPCDFNLFMVQTGTPEKQLKLYDVRLRQTEIHSFGWKQESSDSQSALINQAWSPDGLYVSSGTADPMIHIFDIRYNSHKPSQSISAHHKRVFKAVWLPSQPLLISISSDLNVGLHKI